MADGSYAPLATSGGDAENPTTTAVGRADRRPLLGGDGAVPAPAETSALGRADPPTAGGSDSEWAAAGGTTVEAWLAGIDLTDYAAKIEGYGYSSLRFLRDATEEDIVEMTEDAGVAMKKPHRRTMVAAWRKLALAPAGEPEPEPEPEPPPTSLMPARMSIPLMLSKVPLLMHLSAHDKARLPDMMEAEDFAADATIISQGDIERDDD
eukprot:COSAG06_NODE_20550_length_791_cov_1.426301_2_plen_207_part_01